VRSSSKARVAALGMVLLTILSAAGCSSQVAVTAAPTPDIAATVQAAVATAVAEERARVTPTPAVDGRAEVIKQRLRQSILTYDTEVWSGKAAVENLVAIGNPSSRFLVRKYLEGLVQRARDDDTLAEYLLYMAPALDISGQVQLTLLDSKFLDRFSRSMAESGLPPTQVLSLLTSGERLRYDAAVRAGNQNCSSFLYASLR
jgi:hypothetical protein